MKRIATCLGICTAAFLTFSGTASAQEGVCQDVVDDGSGRPICMGVGDPPVVITDPVIDPPSGASTSSTTELEELIATIEGR